MLIIPHASATLKGRVTVPFTLVLGLLIFPATVLPAECYQRNRAIFKASLDIMTIPIYMAASEDVIVSGGTVTVTVGVNSVPSSGATIMIGCDNPSALAPPQGTWPYALAISPDGNASGSLTITGGQPSGLAPVHIYCYPADASTPMDPACWQQCTTISVVSSLPALTHDTSRGRSARSSHSGAGVLTADLTRTHVFAHACLFGVRAACPPAIAALIRRTANQ